MTTEEESGIKDKIAIGEAFSQCIPLKWTPVMIHIPDRPHDPDHLVYRTKLDNIPSPMLSTLSDTLNGALAKDEQERYSAGGQFVHSLRGIGAPAVSVGHDGVSQYLQIAAGIVEDPKARKVFSNNPNILRALSPVMTRLPFLEQRPVYSDPEFAFKLSRMAGEKAPYADILEREYRKITPTLRTARPPERMKPDPLPEPVAKAIELAAGLHSAPDVQWEQRFCPTSIERNVAFKERLTAACADAGLDVKDREILKILDKAPSTHVRCFNDGAESMRVTGTFVAQPRHA